MSLSKQYEEAMEQFLDIIAQSSDYYDAEIKLKKWLGSDSPLITSALSNYHSIKEENKHRNSKLHKALR